MSEKRNPGFTSWVDVTGGFAPRPHALGDVLAVLALDRRDVELALQVEPELRAVTEIAAEPHRRVGGDRAAAVENVGDAAGRHADVERQPVGGQLARGKLAFQETAGMCDGGMILSSVVIDDLDLVGIALAKLEADAPAGIHSHRPLILPVVLELQAAAVHLCDAIFPIASRQWRCHMPLMVHNASE